MKRGKEIYLRSSEKLKYWSFFGAQKIGENQVLFPLYQGYSCRWSTVDQFFRESCHVNIFWSSGIWISLKTARLDSFSSVLWRASEVMWNWFDIQLCLFRIWTNIASSISWIHAILRSTDKILSLVEAFRSKNIEISGSSTSTKICFGI